MSPKPRDVDARSAVLVCVYVAASALALFAFGASYSHIYDLGIANGQHAWAAKLTPLSIDVLIVVASLVILLQRISDETPAGLAKALPRAMLYAGIAATLFANYASGKHWTGLDPYLSAWPAAVFAATVETVFVAVRRAVRWLSAQLLLLASRRFLRRFWMLRGLLTRRRWRRGIRCRVIRCISGSVSHGRRRTRSASRLRRRR